MLDKIKQSFGFPLSLSAIKKRLLIGICISAVSVFASASEESQLAEERHRLLRSGKARAAETSAVISRSQTTFDPPSLARLNRTTSNAKTGRRFSPRQGAERLRAFGRPIVGLAAIR